MKRSHKLGLFGLGLAGAVSAIALSATAAPESVKLAGTRVDNFMLPDQTGMGHELYYFKDTRRRGDRLRRRWAMTCRESAKAALERCSDSYKDKNVHFVMLELRR